MQVVPGNHECSASGLDVNSGTQNTDRSDFKHLNKEHFYIFESIVHVLHIERENPILENILAEHLPPVKVKIKFLEFPDIEINEEDFINNKNNIPDLFPDMHRHLEGINEEGFVGVNRLKSSIQLDLLEGTTRIFFNHLNESILKIHKNNDLSGKMLYQVCQMCELIYLIHFDCWLK